MAEPGYGAASWAHYSTSPGPQAAAELTAPLLSAHAPFQQQLPPLYSGPYLPTSNPTMAQIQDVQNAPANDRPQGLSPYPPVGSRQQFYHPHMYSYQFTGPPRPPPAWNGSDQLHADHSFFNPGNMTQGHQLSSPPGTSFPGYQMSGSSNAEPPPYARRRYEHRMSVGSLARTSHAEGMRGSYEAFQASAPGVRSQHSRPPQEHGQASEQTHAGSGPRPWMSAEVQGRRSDRSISPRTSHRRNFERYSVDLSHSSTSSDAEEAAARAPPLNRMRHRPREVRPRFVGRPHVDPNIATPRQLQELKDGLTRRLPSELPEEASKACDICQKDYSTTRVAPTEEEEIAIVLSCGHSFGEFCMFEWVSELWGEKCVDCLLNPVQFDTCRRHKNKVTCPMCRKQLIEAPRHMQSMMHAFPRHGQAFADLLARETLLAREQLLANGFRGDFGDLDV